MTSATALPPVNSADEVTVLAGSTFCRSSRNGDIDGRRAQGLFHRDTRIISQWELLVDDQVVTPLATDGGGSFWANFLGHGGPRSNGVEPTVVVERHRYIGTAMREDLVIHNYSPETLGLSVRLLVGADFADLFDVKDGQRRRRRGSVSRKTRDGVLALSRAIGGTQRGVSVRTVDGEVDRFGISWRVAIAPRSQWRTTIHALPSDESGAAAPDFPDDQPVAAAQPARELRDWQDTVPRFFASNWALQQAVDRSLADIASLRLPDPQGGEGLQAPIMAAGAPWFMTLFGRDSLLTSLMLLPWDRDIARGTLRALARRQGTTSDPFSEEEPGKILHELRDGLDTSVALGGSSVYYGSVDATPLFVVLLAAAARWGMARDDIAELLPAADLALGWIADWGDADGDGFVEYQRKTDRGLLNQGWKDSFDAIGFAAGELASGPIAVAEVQGYVYAAFRGRAELARLFGDDGTAAQYDEKAAQLAAAFEEAFWLPECGYYALALDGLKQPVDALASNQGHCLWTGIASEEHAAQVAQLCGSELMFTGWGVRTLATSMARFNPVSYHNGSVWPHDNALLVAGLMRYGQVEVAHRVADGLIAASAATGGRLPELFCGFDRSVGAAPVEYPTACSPQAWAAAAPLSLITSILQLQPDNAAGVVSAAGKPPVQWGRIALDGIRVGEAEVSVAAGSDH